MILTITMLFMRKDSFEEIAQGINIELNNNKKIIGIEILKASRFLGKVKTIVQE